MKNVLITGANSYIGDCVKEYLENYPKDYNVAVKDAVGWKPAPQDFKGYDVVFNVAGIAHIKETQRNRRLYYDINCGLVISIAKAAKRGGVGQFILLSSMSVYGKTTGHIKKGTKPNPVNAYGKSKLKADRAIRKLSDEKFKFACLRLPMVYGQGCRGNYQILRRFALKSPIFPDYDNKRSMIYIGNLCEFVKEVIDKGKRGTFFPQNIEYVRTTNMVRQIACCHGKKIRLTKAFNPIFRMAGVHIVKKVFGNLTYDKVDLVSKYEFEDSIRLTEGIQPFAKTQPLVTILTVSYNSEDTISRTISAVFNQTYSNIEYIIIDGASIDKTVENARSYQEIFDSTPGRSLLIISEPDKGMYDALNKGARLAHGELVGQINADDWYELDAVEMMVDYYQKYHYDFAWGNIRVYKPTGVTIKKANIGHFWTTAGWCHPASFSKREVLIDHPYILESMYDDFYYMISLRKQGKKVMTFDHLISNFNFGGMSTQKKLSEVKKRAETRYKVYQSFEFPKVYKLHCYAIEIVKYMIG